MRLIVIGVLVLTSFVWGADYYVSTGGSDSGPGTLASPWRTVGKAADTMVAGDTVYIRAGTYNERVEPRNSGTGGNYITYTAYNNEIVTIDGSGVNIPDGWGGLFDITNRNYIKVSGLRVIDAGPDDNHCGILVDNCNYITIEKNYTYNTASSGIGVWNSTNIIIDNNEVEKACNDGEQECITVAITDTFEVKNNTVHDGGPGSIGGEGIDAKDGVSNGKIYNNHVYNLNRLGIYVDSWDKHTYNIQVYNNNVHDIAGADGFTVASESGGLLENVNIYNNIAYNCGVCGITVSRNGDSANHPMKNINIINNTFYNNGVGSWGGGIAVDNPDIQQVVIRNNICNGNLSFQIEVEPDVSMGELTIDYNLVYPYRNYDDEVRGNNYVESDPQFDNAAAADFHLTENSPAIDAGTSSNAPATDYDGNNRPQGSGFDIGAFEYAVDGGGGPDEEDPFGSFDTPAEGAVIRSSVAVTGWALDDVAVDNVKIYRDPVPGEGSGWQEIGQAVMVEGARPDIETQFPGYPNNSRAGWGYMMLTNFLPNGGNGTFILHAVVADTVGNSVVLGSKTVTCDNALAVKPFGAIETPAQGGIASGTAYRNWGWVLTPPPNKIPEDGTTIEVQIDNVTVGNPVYGLYRGDVAALFPGYLNSDGAFGYFDIDTTQYANGVHIIQWFAVDSAGNKDGIGSRYFTIRN